MSQELFGPLKIYMFFSVLPIWMFLGSLTLISWKMQFEAFHWNFHKILNKKQLKYMSVICVFSNPLSFEHRGCNAHSLGTQTTRSGQNTTYIKKLFMHWPKWLLNMKIQTFWHTKSKKSEKFWSHQKLPSKQLCRGGKSTLFCSINEFFCGTKDIYPIIYNW